MKIHANRGRAADTPDAGTLNLETIVPTMLSVGIAASSANAFGEGVATYLSQVEPFCAQLSTYAEQIACNPVEMSHHAGHILLDSAGVGLASALAVGLVATAWNYYSSHHRNG
jgi:hypothetical protein